LKLWIFSMYDANAFARPLGSTTRFDHMV